MVSKEVLEGILKIKMEKAEKVAAEGIATKSLTREVRGVGIQQFILELADTIEFATGIKLDLPGYTSPKPPETTRQEPRP